MTAADQQPDTGPATLDTQHGILFTRVTAVLADLEHVRAKAGTTHHDACWDEHAGCLAVRIRTTLTGEDQPQ